MYKATYKNTLKQTHTRPKQSKTAGNHLPRNVAEGELYARYSLLEHQGGNSDCLSGPVLISPSSFLFQGRLVSRAVGVVTLVSSLAAENRVTSDNSILTRYMSGGSLSSYLYNEYVQHTQMSNHN